MKKYYEIGFNRIRFNQLFSNIPQTKDGIDGSGATPFL